MAQAMLRIFFNNKLLLKNAIVLSHKKLKNELIGINIIYLP